METQHKTLTFSRRLKATPAALFSALSDPVKRSQWSPPSPEEVIEFTKPAFGVGEVEISTCGTKGSPEYIVDAYYHDIVTDQRIVFSEGVSREGTRLAASLITMEIKEESGTCILEVVIQAASFVGQEMIDGYQHGWTAAFDGLERFFAQP